MAMTVDELEGYYADRAGLAGREATRRARNWNILDGTLLVLGGNDRAPGSSLFLLLVAVFVTDWWVGDWNHVLARLPAPQQVVGWVFEGLDERDLNKTRVEQAQESARTFAAAQKAALAKEMEASRRKAELDTMKKVAEVEAALRLAAAEREQFLARFADWRAGLVQAAGPLQYDWRVEVGPMVTAAAADMARLGPSWRDAELPQACGDQCFGVGVDGLSANPADDGAWQAIATVLVVLARDRRDSFVEESDRIAERVIGVLRDVEPPWAAAKLALLAPVEGGGGLAGWIAARKTKGYLSREALAHLVAWEELARAELEKIEAFLRTKSQTTAAATVTGGDQIETRRLVLGWRRQKSVEGAEAAVNELVSRARAQGDWRGVLAILMQDLRDETGGRYRVAGIEIADRSEAEAELARVKELLRKVVWAKGKVSQASRDKLSAAEEDLNAALRGLARAEGQSYGDDSSYGSEEMIAKVDAGKMSVPRYFRTANEHFAKGRYGELRGHMSALRDWALDPATWRKR